jgi:hypothetical protein
MDSATSVEEWAKAPQQNTKRIAQTFREACSVAEDFGERLAIEGEICWGGMHSWRRNLQLLELVNRPQTLGFQADMAHTMLFPWLQRAGGPLLPEDSTGPDDQLAGLSQQWRAPCVRGPSTCTSRRTMAP